MRLFFVVFFVVFCCHSNAQKVLAKPEIYLGASVGITESKVRFSPSIEQNYLMGFNGGIVFRLIGEKNLGMQTELNYAQQGWKEKSGLYGRRLHYVELPFMTHIYFGKNNRFFLLAGTRLAYLLSEELLKNSVTTNLSEQYLAPIQNPFEYGLCGGAGFSVNMHKNVYQIDTRFYYGLSDLFSNKKSDYFDASANIGISVHIGWMLQLQ